MMLTMNEGTLNHLSGLEIPSAEQVVYEALRQEIVGGLAPGTSLKLGPLADRFQVSTMPVRAALSRLEAEGLVTQRPRRGAVVAPITIADFLDLYAIRMGLEGVAARIAAPVLSDDLLSKMRTVLAQLTTAASSNETRVDEYAHLQWSLHDLCFAQCQRPQMLKLIGIYRMQSERYFRFYLGRAVDLGADLEGQHRFVDACSRHDPGAAEEAVRSLFLLTTNQVLLEFSEETPRNIPLVQLATTRSSPGGPNEYDPGTREHRS